MSNTGVLSAEYRQATQFAERIDRAVGHAERSDLSRQDCTRLATMLRSVASLLGTSQGTELDGRALLTVPPAVVSRLRQEDVALEKQTLTSLADRIYESDGGLGVDDVRLLRDIARTAEVEAARVYTRMIRD